MHLGCHVKRTHHITLKEYYDKFFKKENEGKCEVCNKDTVFVDCIIGYATFCSSSCVSRSPRLKQKRIDTSMKNRGTTNFSSSYEGRCFHREKRIKEREFQKNNGLPIFPTMGIIEIECIKELQTYTNFKIVQNVKNYGFYPDGYISELNLIIEFDENFHKNTLIQDKDREDQLKYFLNCLFFRINIDDWLNNKEHVIENFKNTINWIKL
jgi:very-short-patch-repair endonuclease